MRGIKGHRLVLALLMACVVAAGGTASARADFYQGKQLVVLINFAQGGPTDAEGRLVARHIARVLGGGPAVIVTNMDGSNGALAANWLARVAAPDGLIVGYFSGIAGLRALSDPVLSSDVARLAFVAASSSFGVTYARPDLGGGLTKPSDIAGVKDFWVGGTRPQSDRDLRVRMQLDLLGIRYKYQSGFASANDARLAFQRGEIQMLLEPLSAYRATIEPTLVANKLAMPLWVDPLDNGESFTRAPEAGNLPALNFTDMLTLVRGSLPKSELFDAWRLVNQMGTLFQRIVVIAPDTPPVAVATLRRAFAKLGEDAAFREDAMKTLKAVPSFQVDDQTAAVFQRIADPEPRLQAFLKKYIEQVAPAERPAAVAPQAK